MSRLKSRLGSQEKEALLIMFGALWQKRFWSLDGKAGRPSLSQSIDFAMCKYNQKAKEDLVNYLEDYLTNMSRRCEVSAQN